jgi:transcriptional regulator with XRE-family HTH domain
MLGNQLKEYRKKKGYTQEEAADVLGVVRQTISKWEHETAVPDADMLQKLAMLYGVSVSDLLRVSPEQVQEPNRLAEELEKLNDSMAKQLATQNKVRKVMSVLGVLLLVWGGIGIVMGGINYYATMQDSALTGETVGVVLSASINLITKGAAKAIVGVMLLVVSGYIKRR